MELKTYRKLDFPWENTGQELQAAESVIISVAFPCGDRC